jgi:hypothetical protein
MRRADAFERITSVLYEFEATHFSVARTLSQASMDPSILPTQSRFRPFHLRVAAANLEVTFALRMFAEFEAALQDYWTTASPTSRTRRAQMQTLINRTAARRRIPTAVVAEAHEVRAYRNAVVHDRLRAPRLTIHNCKSRLSRFITYLPLNWEKETMYQTVASTAPARAPSSMTNPMTMR